MQDRINRWKQVFETDSNSISNALSKLAWDLVVYNCVVHMVRSAPKDDRTIKINSVVLDMLATGFWSNTMQGIRRLAERGPINGPMGVCSLGALIEDVRAVRHRLTREVFVTGIAGLNYNYEWNRRKEFEYVLAHGPGAMWIPREFDNSLSEDRHALFDQLSGVTLGASLPTDIIRDEVFERMLSRLDGLDHVVQHAHTMIAHAATEASRNGRVLEHWDLPSAKESIRELAQIAELVGAWFCASGIGNVLPTPQFDQFEHLEQPLYAGDKDKLQAIWDELDHEISQWHSVDPEPFLA